MKKSLFCFIITIFSLASCGGGNKTSLDGKDDTPADSMMYYFGIMQANNFWQDAENDTLLRTQEGRDNFIKGFEDAMKMESDNDAYNQGLQLGLRLAIRLREFKALYGMDFPEEMLVASFAQSLKDDHNFNVADAQKEFYKIKDRLDLQKRCDEVAGAKKNLGKIAGKEGFTMVSDTLYAKDVTAAGAGPKFKDGDHVKIELTAATVEGKAIERQFPDNITIGEGKVPRVVCLGLHTMTDGQTRSFMTTPRTFLKRPELYGLEPDEPVVFTIKVTRD